MLHRKLYTIAILSLFLIMHKGFFAAQAETTDQYCDPSTDRSFEHIIACYHLKVNDITNKQYANLKKFNQSISPNRTPSDANLPNISSQDQKVLMAPTQHYEHSNQTAREQAVRECKLEIETLININPQCLITLSLEQFYKTDQEIQTFIQTPTNQSQSLAFQTYWNKHRSDILDMLESNVTLYNQVFMSYPIHENIIKMQSQAALLNVELSKSIEILKNIPNKFENASTTECT